MFLSMKHANRFRRGRSVVEIAEAKRLSLPSTMLERIDTQQPAEIRVHDAMYEYVLTNDWL